MKTNRWRFSSRDCCTCTSTSIEPCDYCMRELCQSCADDVHDCDGDACDCGCETTQPDEPDDNRDHTAEQRRYENWLESLKDRGGR